MKRLRCWLFGHRQLTPARGTYAHGVFVCGSCDEPVQRDE